MTPLVAKLKAFIDSHGKKKSYIALGVVGCLALGGLGTTLAANINLNGGSNVEFGQGVVSATACDHEVLITPYSEFVNGSPGDFFFKSITLSNLDATDSINGSLEGCQGKSFVIKMYKENGDRIDRSYVISVGVDSFSSGDGQVTYTNAGTDNSSVSLTFRSTDVLATDVYTITVESTDFTGGLWAVRDGSHLYQIHTMDNAENIDFGKLHDGADTQHPDSVIGYGGGTWGISGLGFNRADGKLYVLLGKVNGESHTLYKFTPPVSGNSDSIINVTRVGIIDASNNNGNNWTGYGLRGLAINSQGQIWTSVHGTSGNLYAHILRLSPTDASILENIDLNADTSDPSTGINQFNNKHAYSVAFDPQDQLWFTARVDDSSPAYTNFWTVNNGAQVWRGRVLTQYTSNGYLAIDSRGLFWISDWNNRLYSFNPNGQQPGDLTLTNRGTLPDGTVGFGWVR